MEAIRSAGEVLSKYPETHLFKEGTAADAAYLIESGEVEIYRGIGQSRRVVCEGGHRDESLSIRAEPTAAGSCESPGDLSSLACGRASST